MNLLSKMSETKKGRKGSSMCATLTEECGFNRKIPLKAMLSKGQSSPHNKDPIEEDQEVS